MRPNNSLLHRLLAHVMLPVGFFRGLPAAWREAQTGETEPLNPTTRFEPMDLHFTAVLLTGLGLLLAVWAITVLIYPFFNYLEHARGRSSPPPIPAARLGNPIPPGPRIQENPRRDMRYMRAYEEGLLNRFRWIDRSRGIAAIPIDVAIRMVARKGIPPVRPPAGQTYFDPHEGARLTGFEGKVEPEPR